MRVLAAILTMMLIAGASLSMPAAAKSPTKPLIEVFPLPPEKVLPLTGDQCSCAAFRQGAGLNDESILVSTTSELAHVRLAKQDYKLSQRSRKLVGKKWVNVFASGRVSVTLETAETSYEKFCSAYADPPPHGSCYVGTMQARVGATSTTIPVVELCGC